MKLFCSFKKTLIFIIIIFITILFFKSYVINFLQSGYNFYLDKFPQHAHRFLSDNYVLRIFFLQLQGADSNDILLLCSELK